MRKDGKRVRGDDPMYSLIPQFLTKKYDAMNMVTVDVPVEPMRQYMNAKRREGVRISHLALLIAAYNRVAAEYPKVNRFVKRKTIYQHNDMTVSMVVLRPGGDGDTMSKIYLDPNDTVLDVQRKIDAYISENRQETSSNKLDKAMGVLLRMQGLVTVACTLLRWLDNIGLMPKSLIRVSPFHASLLVSNLASIRTNHIYHHVYEFGTTSVAVTMGNMREIPRRGQDGEIVLERCIPLGVVMDERICSGHYFAQAFARLKELLKDPTLLE